MRPQIIPNLHAPQGQPMLVKCVRPISRRQPKPSSKQVRHNSKKLLNTDLCCTSKKPAVTTCEQTRRLLKQGLAQGLTIRLLINKYPVLIRLFQPKFCHRITHCQADEPFFYEFRSTFTNRISCFGSIAILYLLN